MPLTPPTPTIPSPRPLRINFVDHPVRHVNTCPLRATAPLFAVTLLFIESIMVPNHDDLKCVTLQHNPCATCSCGPPQSAEDSGNTPLHRAGRVEDTGTARELLVAAGVASQLHLEAEN